MNSNTNRWNPATDKPNFKISPIRGKIKKIKYQQQGKIDFLPIV